MKALSAIISTFTEDEKRDFLLFLQKKNRRGDVKNGKLFKLIDAGKTKDLDLQLYGKPSKNAYHALSKRLQDSLIDFVASKSFAGETSEEMNILKLLLASRIFFEHKQYKIAFKTLLKAEQAALALDVYAILTEIYHTKIQYAHLNPTIDLQQLITASQLNSKLLLQEQQLNMAYATIKEGLKSKKHDAINELIMLAFSSFDIDLNKTLTYKSLFQLMNITTTAARLQSDYHNISPFMMQLYDIINEKQTSNTDTEKHLFYHIEILNLMAFTSFRNKDFKNSISFTAQMEIEMQKKKCAYYNRFIEKLKLLQALNLNYTGKPNEAIVCLQEFQGASLDVDLTLVMCLFQQDEYQEAYNVLKRLNHSDTWYEKKAGWLWVLKKNIIEILLLIERNKLELVLSRTSSFQNRFSKRLKASGETRVLNFIQLANYYYEHPKKVTSEAFKERVENTFEWIGAEREDIFVMSFYGWLKSKMEQNKLYEITLELVNQTKTPLLTQKE